MTEVMPLTHKKYFSFTFEYRIKTFVRDAPEQDEKSQSSVDFLNCSTTCNFSRL